MRTALAALVLVAGAGFAVAQEPAGPALADPRAVVGAPRGQPLSGPALEALTDEVAAVLRCPVCQGLSVADSPTELARNMKRQARELLAAGYDREQVLAYFEASYGEFVRLQPPLRGVNWLVWVAPVLGLLAGGFIVMRALGRSRRAPAAAAAPVEEVDPALAPYLFRVRALAYGWPGGIPPAGPADTDKVVMPASVDWVPGLVVLAVGLVGGFLLVRRLVRGAAPVSAPDARTLRRRDLEARRDALIDQLRDLHDSASGGAERVRLEHEAARVLRDLDGLPATELAGGAAPSAPPAPTRPDRAALKGFLWGTGSAAAIGLLLFLASRSTSEREEGGSLTGEIPGGGAAEVGAAGTDAEMAPLQAAVERNPDDLEARMALARAALTRQDMMVVFDQTRAVLQKDPRHARALSYQALVRLAMGQADTAEKMLRQALEIEPDLLEGYIHLTLVHLRQGRMDAAEKDIEEAARRNPAHAARLRSLWAEMRDQAAAAPAEGAAGGEDPHAGVEEPPARAAGGAARRRDRRHGRAVRGLHGAGRSHRVRHRAGGRHGVGPADRRPPPLRGVLPVALRGRPGRLDDGSGPARPPESGRPRGPRRRSDHP